MKKHKETIIECINSAVIPTKVNMICFTLYTIVCAVIGIYINSIEQKIVFYILGLFIILGAHVLGAYLATYEPME